jgi:ribosomal small subunit protein bTHX
MELEKQHYFYFIKSKLKFLIMGKGDRKIKRGKIVKGSDGVRRPKKPLQLRHKKTALMSRRFSVIWFGVVFCFDLKNGTPNKGKHHGVQFVPTFCI